MSEQIHQLLLGQLPKLRAYALLLTGNRADADDLVQSTALLAIKNKSQFEIGTNFGAWTYRIMRNSYIGGHRSNKERPVSLEGTPEACFMLPETQEESVLTREVIRTMDMLPPQLREVLILICGAEISYQDAADALSCSMGTVKSRLWRAREKMRSLLLDEQGENPVQLSCRARRNAVTNAPLQF